MSAEFIESRRQSANPGFPSKLPLKWCVCEFFASVMKIIQCW